MHYPKSKSSINPLYGNKNSLFVLSLFWITILFSLTGLKFIWSLENISRIVNILILVVLIAYAIKEISAGSYSKELWCYYLLPGLLIFGGMFLNISINALSNFNLVSFFGLTLPWLVYLIVPSLMKKKTINTETLWYCYYYFMLCSVLLSLLEYVLIFLYDASYLEIIKTPNGEFFRGYFSLFYSLDDGTVHYRLYACFLEPGTLAMYLLPAISYAVFYKKYLGLSIILVGFYLTDSLGGIISLILLVAVLSFILTNRKKSSLVFALLAFITISCLLWYNLEADIKDQYEKRDNSATTREESFNKTLINLPLMIITNPFGMKLAEDTTNFEKNELYTGANFIPGTYLQYGGIFSFAGYLVCLIVSCSLSLKAIIKGGLTLEEKVIFSSILVILPFTFQRSTIWESALFALLFAPSIIRQIEGKTKSIQKN